MRAVGEGWERQYRENKQEVIRKEMRRREVGRIMDKVPR